MLRIISGKFKNRLLPISRDAKFKPSTTRTREAIFSIIGSWSLEQTLEGAYVADLCCGSGSLGMEALSRGAAFVSFIDSDLQQIRNLKEFVNKLGQQDNVGFLHTNVERLPLSNRLYNIVFIDPPYFGDLVSITLKNLVRGNWLANGAVIIVEVSARDDFQLPAGFTQFDKRVYGNNKLVFLVYEQS